MCIKIINYTPSVSFKQSGFLILGALLKVKSNIKNNLFYFRKQDPNIIYKTIKVRQKMYILVPCRKG